MRVLLLYDISHDRTRAKVADLCLDYALQRLQFSAFTGAISQTLAEELMLKIAALPHDDDFDVQLIPICAADWGSRQRIAGKTAQGRTQKPRDLWTDQSAEADDE